MSNEFLTAPIVGPLNLLTPAVSVDDGEVSIGTGTSTTASAGSNGVPPEQVAGYLEAYIGNILVKIPYYGA
jgi:hypothetical protein